MTLKDINEIKKSLDTKKLIIGANETIKNIKLGKVSIVYLSNNCHEDIKKDIERYSKIAKIDFSVLNKSSEELGVICKKPFSITVLSILSGNNK